MPQSKHVVALDGLRAVAVVVVLLFHLQVPGFRAGFLGVDVFFVLSGFLITSLLLNEARRTGHISLAEFWTRRFRRLMPALVLVLLTVAAVGGLTATLSQRAALRADLLSTAFYIANWHFIGTSSYFNDDGVESPLEHAWSLAIEEQFYVLWPLIVAVVVALAVRWAAGRRRSSATAQERFLAANKAVAGVAGLLVVASVVLLSALWAPDGVERAYMGTDSRVFEPLIGALGATAIVTARGRALAERHGRWLALLGAVGLVASLIVVRGGTALYYRGGALFASLSTLILVMSIWVDRGTFVGRVLGLRPVAWLGAVSYGVYLWHWPFIVWTDVREAQGTRRLLLSGLVITATLVVSALSYYVVERPIRSGWIGMRLPPRRVALAVPLALLVVSGTAIAATNETIESVPAQTPVVMVTGDSVPKKLTTTLEERAESRGWVIADAAAGGCPVTGEYVITSDERNLAEGPLCPTRIPQWQAEGLEADPDVVVWWDRFSLADWRTPDGEHIRAGTERFWSLRQAALETHVERLTASGAKVVFVETEPPGPGIWTRCTPERCHEWLRRQIDDYDELTQRWNAMMEEFAAEHPDKAAYVSFVEQVCHDDEVPCDDEIGGVTARSDGVHYSGEGRELAADLLLDRLAPLLR